MRYLMNTINSIPLMLVCYISLCLSTTEGYGQDVEGLTRLEGFQTETYYSAGAKEQALDMATRCDKVMAFYGPLIDFQPTVKLLVLSPTDWSRHTSFPVYGMPHYTDAQTLIVASEDNDFWRSFIPDSEQLPAALFKQVTNTYTDHKHELSMRGFFDLLAIHELGHAFHSQGGLTMQRKWMGELFANILLHTYVAEKEPELLPALTLFPQMVVSSTVKDELKYITLQQLESNYDLIGQQHPNNYGWYQCRWHMAAADIYDAGGVSTFIQLWQALKNQKEPLDDTAFTRLLTTDVHPAVAAVPLNWDEK